jgi:hypothetical protein
MPYVLLLIIPPKSGALPRSQAIRKPKKTPP